MTQVLKGQWYTCIAVDQGRKIEYRDNLQLFELKLEMRTQEESQRGLHAFIYQAPDDSPTATARPIVDKGSIEKPTKRSACTEQQDWLTNCHCSINKGFASFDKHVIALALMLELSSFSKHHS